MVANDRLDDRIQKNDVFHQARAGSFLRRKADGRQSMEAELRAAGTQGVDRADPCTSQAGKPRDQCKIAVRVRLASKKRPPDFSAQALVAEDDDGAAILQTFQRRTDGRLSGGSKDIPACCRTRLAIQCRAGLFGGA